MLDCEKTTEHNRNSICCAHLPMYGGAKSDAGENFATVVGVGRDKNCFNLEQSLIRYGGAHNTFFWGVRCAAVDHWWMVQW